MAAHQSTDRERLRLTVLVNIIAPYRLPIYQALAERFDLTVLITGVEDDRVLWSYVPKELKKATVKTLPGWVLKRNKQEGGGVFESRYLHLNPLLLLNIIRSRPDAVVTNEMGFRSLMALLYGTLWRRPVWIWWGGTCHTEAGTGIGRRLVRGLVSRWARRWISYGQTSTEYLQTLGIPLSRILQIQNCVDESVFVRPCASSLQVHPKPVLLCVGRLVRLKGVDRFLEAAAVLQREGMIFSILFVGDGPERDRLRRQAAELGLNNLHWVDGVPPRDMPGLYRSADLLVFPTLRDVWGLVVNEALWSGLPVIASKYAGCAAELLPESHVFDPLDHSAFVDVLRKGIQGQFDRVDQSALLPVGLVTARLVADIELHTRRSVHHE